MTLPHGVAGLILAGGASRRMGSPKALLPYGGETFLDRMIRMFAGVTDPLLVVLGHDAERIAAGARRAGEARLVVNPDWERGQLSSLQCGLRALPLTAPAVLFSPVDYAPVRPETVAAVAAEAALGRALVFPRHQGRKGHPVACSRALIEELLALPVESQAREVTRRHADEACFVDVDDPAVLTDIDDPAAYRELLKAGPCA